MMTIGYEVATAASGDAALAAVRREHPDVILIDVNMPRLDGFEVCRRLRNDPATRLIPVVVLTGLSETEDRLRGIDAGVDDFLTKPFVVAELNARLRSLTRLKRDTVELDSAEGVILCLALTIEARDCVPGETLTMSLGIGIGRARRSSRRSYRQDCVREPAEFTVRSKIRPPRCATPSGNTWDVHGPLGERTTHV